MIQKQHISVRRILLMAGGLCLLALFAYVPQASAINQIPEPDPIPGSYGIGATKQQAPPTQSAAISTPGNGTSFTTSPVTVTGICEDGLLVQLYNNDVMVGSVMCDKGSFSIQVSLFAGRNELSATLYDDLEQAGPPSNVVTVNYEDSRLTAFGQLITLTSTYGRRSAAAGSQLEWPLQISGGTGPYAFSIDWGDGAPTELKSQSIAGTLAILHTYEKAGIYPVNIRVTDANGVSAFLQLVAVGSGKVEPATDAPAGQTERVIILWIPAVVALILLIPTYWLGRRSQVVSLRNKMLKDREAYDEDGQSAA